MHRRVRAELARDTARSTSHRGSTVGTPRTTSHTSNTPVGTPARRSLERIAFWTVPARCERLTPSIACARCAPRERSRDRSRYLRALTYALDPIVAGWTTPGTFSAMGAWIPVNPVAAGTYEAGGNTRHLALGRALMPPKDCTALVRSRRVGTALSTGAPVGVASVRQWRRAKAHSVSAE